MRPPGSPQSASLGQSSIVPTGAVRSCVGSGLASGEKKEERKKRRERLLKRGEEAEELSRRFEDSREDPSSTSGFKEESEDGRGVRC